MPEAVVVTATFAEFGRIPSTGDGLLDRLGLLPGEDCFDPRRRLGRKGLYGKDRATLLAMSCAAELFDAAALAVPSTSQDPAYDFGVAVSSNLGNLESVCRVLDAVGQGSSRDASMLDAPNVSSNVIASNLAIRFGLRGPNFTLCGGAPGGVDAIHLAANCIRAGRAQRMLVLGVEVDNAVTRKLVRPGPSLDAAVALLLESESSAGARTATPWLTLGAYCHAPTQGTLQSALEVDCGVAADKLLWIAPQRLSERVGSVIETTAQRLPRHDLVEAPAPAGDAYGALGPLQVALALELLQSRSERDRRAQVTSVVITAGGEHGEANASLVLLHCSGACA